MLRSCGARSQTTLTSFWCSPRFTRWVVTKWMSPSSPAAMSSLNARADLRQRLRAQVAAPLHVRVRQLHVVAQQVGAPLPVADQGDPEGTGAHTAPRPTSMAGTVRRQRLTSVSSDWL